MPTIKSFTDLSQSRKLAEILPLESADGFWEYHDKWCSEGDEWEGYEDYPRAEPYLEYTRKENEWKEDKSDIPCWSLATLFNALPDTITNNDGIAFGLNVKKYIIEYSNPSLYLIYKSVKSDNPIDACYEMVLKLKESDLI